VGVNLLWCCRRSRVTEPVNPARVSYLYVRRAYSCTPSSQLVFHLTFTVTFTFTFTVIVRSHSNGVLTTQHDKGTMDGYVGTLRHNDDIIPTIIE